jgi:tetratricopeptide (TPR) repeat protein
MDALRKYSAAERAVAAGDYLRGASLYEEAIALDTTFAMAYMGLATFLGEASFQVERMTELLQKAYDHRERVGAIERHLIEFAYWSYGPTVDYDKAIAAVEAALAIDPDNVEALKDLGDVMRNVQQHERAADAQNRVLAADSSRMLSCYFLVVAHTERRMLDSAQAVLDACGTQGIPHPALAYTQAELALVRNDDSTATALAEGLIATQNPIAAEWGYVIRASIAGRRGRLREMRPYQDRFNELLQRRGVVQARIGAVSGGSLDRVLYYGDSAGAVRRLDSALARVSLDELPARDRPYLDLAVVYAFAGRPDRARQYVEAIRRTHPTAISVFGSRILPFVEGMLARAEGRYADAIASFRESGRVGCTSCSLPYIADAYDKAGQADSAIAVYERYVNSTSVDFRMFIDQYWLAPSYRRLGELYEARGDRGNARKYYESFVEIWRDADAELQPQVRAVRERLRVVGAGDR